MTALNTVLGALTGPRRLRSALRRKTVAIQSLLVALDSPTELRATIPAAVFGGDIFNVMSSQLREALIAPPPRNTIVSIARRRRSLPSFEDPLAKHSEDVFSFLAARLKPSMLTTEARSFRESERSISEPQASGGYSIQKNPSAPQALAQALKTTAFESVAVSQHPTIASLTPLIAKAAPATRLAPAAPALVNVLDRYWRHSRETNRPDRATERVPGVEQSNGSRNLLPANVDQPGSSLRSNSLGGDALNSSSTVDDKRRSSTENNGGVAIRTLRSEPNKSVADPDFSFHSTNNYAPLYDDLGDRLAQILHEQALQHGIDVT